MRQTTPPTRPQVRHASQHMVREKAGLKGAAKNVKMEKEAFKLFLSENILEKIVRHTNSEGQRVTDIYNESHPEEENKEFVPTDREELQAVIGLMMMRGVYRAYHKSLQSLWQEDCGRPIFKATMPFQRFKLLVRLLHFGDKTTQEERCRTDKFAPTRAVFNDFMANCEAYYTLSDSITIDKTLRKFRGQCPFKVYYMPNKPGKYGILFRVLTDAKARYVYKMIP